MQTEKPPKKIVRVFVTSVTLIWKYVGINRLIVLIGVTFISGLIPPLSIYIGKMVLDAIVGLLQTSSAVNISVLYQALSMQLAVILGGFWLQQFSGFIAFTASQSMAINIRSEILHKASNLSYKHFDEPEIHDIITRAQRQAGDKPFLFIKRVLDILRNIVVFISMAGLILCFNPLLFMVMIIISLPGMFIQMKYGKRNYEVFYNRTQASRMQNYVSGQIMSRRSRPELASLGILEYMYNRWRTSAEEFKSQDIRLKRKFTLVRTFIETIPAMCTVGSTAYIVHSAIVRTVPLTVGAVMMYSRAFSNGMNSARTVMTSIAKLYKDALFLSDLDTFNDIVHEDQEECPQKKMIARRTVPKQVGSIEFEDVSFVYPGSKQMVLKNVNLTFAAGTSYLLVGDNGAGKTTLIKLLIRLYEPTSGRILINGVDAREYDIDSLRHSIGVIFQNYLTFAFSARENIGLGCREACEDMERIREAAQRARADSFICKLPAQYETCLSKLFVDGTELSGGQWQRVCLARLFMKDSGVFVFDEPTASLDIATEVHLLREITQLARDRLCILISHRSLRTGIADRIVVLEDGCVDEEGTYDELIARNGSFARLSKLYHTMGEDSGDMYSLGLLSSNLNSAASFPS
jgi:ABC-type multidrug transport system fused ATPase/permease subunit